MYRLMSDWFLGSMYGILTDVQRIQQSENFPKTFPANGFRSFIIVSYLCRVSLGKMLRGLSR
jgi:hypothetical protein